MSDHLWWAIYVVWVLGSLLSIYAHTRGKR